MEFRGDMSKLTSPFKFNATWLQDDGFHNLVKSTWTPFIPNVQCYIDLHFLNNLKILKAHTIPWVDNCKKKNVRYILTIEEQFDTYYASFPKGFKSIE